MLPNCPYSTELYHIYRKKSIQITRFLITAFGNLFFSASKFAKNVNAFLGWVVLQPNKWKPRFQQRHFSYSFTREQSLLASHPSKTAFPTHFRSFLSLRDFFSISGKNVPPVNAVCKSEKCYTADKERRIKKRVVTNVTSAQ